MHIPPVFRDDDIASMHQAIKDARLGTLVTATPGGLVGTPLPMLLDENEGDKGALYAHLARANPQWEAPAAGEAMAIFMGPDAYVTPSWYATKRETQKVVPTWNYVAVHAYGPVEFFDDTDRLLDIVRRLTDLHEQERSEPWMVSDAPADFIKAQLKGIVGLRLPITRLDGKRKLSQNCNAADRAGVIKGLAVSDRPADRVLSALIPEAD